MIAWWNPRVIFVESAGPGDTLKPGQIEWITRSARAGLGAEDTALVAWTIVGPS